MTHLLNRLFRKINALLCLCLVACSLSVSAQRVNGTIVLQDEYGLDYRHDHTLTEHGYTYAQAQAKFKAFTEWAAWAGWSQAEVMGSYEIVAAEHDAFWKTWGYLRETWSFGDQRSRGSIIFPDGAYRVNYPLLIGYGRYIGKGSNCYYEIGTNNAGATSGTAIVIDHNKWMTARSADRACMVTCKWGSDDGNAYSQGTIVEGIYFNGGWVGKAQDPSFVSYGLGIWDSGEASEVRNCYADGFNTYGFNFPKGTPTKIDACSAFSNGIAGLAIRGNNGLSTSTISGFSGDDNKYLILVDALPGQVAGGTIVINGIKSEAGKRQPYRPQEVIHASGALNLTVNGVSADCQNQTCTNAFDIDFQTYPGQVEIHGARLNGYTNALKLSAKGSVLSTTATPGNVVPFTIEAQETGVTRYTRGASTPTTPTTPTNPPVTGGKYLDRTGWKITAFANAPADNFGTHTAAMAIDADKNTFYHSGTSQTSAGNQWITVDMLTSKSIVGLEFSTVQFQNDWPGIVLVQTSTNGTSWTERARTGGGPTTYVSFPAVQARHIRFTPVQAKGPWWAINDLQVVVP